MCMCVSEKVSQTKNFLFSFLLKNRDGKHVMKSRREENAAGFLFLLPYSNTNKIFTFFLPSWTDFLKYLVSADLLKSDKRFALDIMDHAVSEEKLFTDLCIHTVNRV